MMARIFTRALYTLTAYLLTLELLCLYLSVYKPDSCFTQALLIQAKFLSTASEIIALYCTTILEAVVYYIPFTLLLFIRRSQAFRSRLKYLSQRVSQTQASESEKLPEIIPLFFIFFLINGVLFNRKEASPIISGAFEQLSGILFCGHLYVLFAISPIAVAYISFCCISLIYKRSSEVGLQSEEESLLREKVSELSEAELAGDLTMIEKSLMSAYDTLKASHRSIEL